MAQSDSVMLSAVYKSPRKELMFLYVEQQNGLDQVPGDLLGQFGEPEWVLDVELHEGRTLAIEDPAIVMKNIRLQGYHLQMPPADPRRQEGE